jgi:hypothetical protein
MDYRNPDFRRLFSELVDRGWDLPAKSAIALLEALSSPDDLTLEQQFLVARYRLTAVQ